MLLTPILVAYMVANVSWSLTDARTRVNLPEIPGDALSIYINANFIKVRWQYGCTSKDQTNNKPCVFNLLCPSPMGGDVGGCDTMSYEMSIYTAF